MEYILGIDAGTNSLGWALIDEPQKKIINCGVRIFPEGVNRDTVGKEVPKNLQRRTKRQTRRQTFRRKFRKWTLAKCLMQYGMFPKTANLQKVLQQQPLPQELRTFFAIDPYVCRSRAYNGEQLSLLELGRIFYHFTQLRGYKESLKDDDNESGKLYEGSVKDGKIGINETQSLINEHGTLGNALYHTNPHEQRWRNRYTTRNMYTHEFAIIWGKQRAFYPDILNDELKQKIGDATTGLLFFQRPLKPQSHLIGVCSLEPNKKRCSDSCIAFELRRTYEFINSIRLDGLPLSPEQRDGVKILFFTKEKFGFGDIAEKLKISGNRFNYEEERMVVGTRSIFNLRKIFFSKIWDSKPLSMQEEILNIKRFAEDRVKTNNYLKQKFGFIDKQADQFLRFRPSKGYSSLSYKATLNLLPFLEAGHDYHEAVWLGGVLNAFGVDEWNSFVTEKKDYIITNALEIYYNPEYDSISTTRKWLQEEFDLSEKRLNKLYHHSIDLERGDGSLDLLP